MSKTNEQLLIDYKKSNKDRRVKILEKAGFVSEAKYIDWLLNSDKTEEKPTIHNVHIVDISSSMGGGKIASAILGVNTEVDELKKDDSVIYTHTLVEFSEPYHIKTVCYKVPMAEVKPYNTYVRSSTALNQAIGETLTKLKNDMFGEDKVLVKIFTDGGENSSQGTWANREMLSQLIKQCEESGFTITFVGTEYDVNTVIRTLGIHASNTLSHDNTSRGVEMAFMTSANSTSLYAQKIKSKQDVKKGFYKTINQTEDKIK